MASASSPSSSGFFSICLLHAVAATTCGALMMFYQNEAMVVGHGRETAARLLQGSTPRDQLLIQTSDSFAGLLLFAIGLLLFMVAFVEDRDFQAFFAKGCALLHAAVALWRVCFERRVDCLARDWPRQLVGDLVLGLSWLLFLVYCWSDKYD
ncbi:uncharacterized protein LOC135639004 [Musa acuminata AAA Group]|uniref:(wild Malaysian banana) hypothetical protein n=1 Tax=Musa acuminata subsp. malaccensis TaxID=214687 RepID=A0A804J5K7_MUSAM|nr:PREDICTED: uncharacterized protein LOC103973565 [Musa acuminata subsp. malaccensis]CAG1838830.1 unnamed protein product [Musa acuminata subsp. malaccensis]